MARTKDIAAAFRACNGPFPWRRFVSLLRKLGYKEVTKKGKSGGSRVRFFHQDSGHIIMAHRPHDGQMGPELVKRIQRDMIDKGLL